MQNNDNYNKEIKQNIHFNKDDIEFLQNRKDALIQELNNSFRIILSYGLGDDLIPMGQFMLKNVVLGDEYDPTQQLIFTQINNPDIELIVPRTMLPELMKKAQNNFDRFNDEGKISNWHRTSSSMEELATNLLLDLEDSSEIEGLKGVDGIPIQDNGIILIENGVYNSCTECRICPVLDDYYITRIRERLPNDDEKEKKDGSSSNTITRRAYRINEINKNGNVKIERSTPYNSDLIKEALPKFIPEKEHAPEEGPEIIM